MDDVTLKTMVAKLSTKTGKQVLVRLPEEIDKPIEAYQNAHREAKHMRPPSKASILLALAEFAIRKGALPTFETKKTK